MASQREPRTTRSGRPIDPLLAAVKDSVGTGYEALEHVLDGLAESVRLQTGRSVPRHTAARSGHTAGAAGRHERGASSRVRAPSRSAAGLPPGLVQDVATIFAQLLGSAGALAGDVAHTISEQATGDSDGPVPTLALSAAPGETATVPFTVWNTSGAALERVELTAGGLIGAGGRELEGAVKFKPDTIAWIAPGRGETVEIDIPVRARTPAGTYRGIVMAAPGDACAVLELTVTEPEAPADKSDKPAAKATAKRPAKATGKAKAPAGTKTRGRRSAS